MELSTGGPASDQCLGVAVGQNHHPHLGRQIRKGARLGSRHLEFGSLVAISDLQGEKCFVVNAAKWSPVLLFTKWEEEGWVQPTL